MDGDDKERVRAVPHLRIIDDDLWRSAQDRLDAVRRSDQSAAIRKSQFWKDRRPRHLPTGLVRCGECGGAMASIGRDYLACQAARSGAGCTNRKGIRRSRIEEAVLEGQAPEPEPYFHSNLTGLHRDRVAALHQALNEPETRGEAAELLRCLIDRIHFH